MSDPIQTLQAELPVRADSGPLLLSGTEEALVVSEAGLFSACDVWFHVPAAWISRATLRLYGRVGLARVLLRQVALAKVPLAGDASWKSGLAISMRGRPCDAFEVTCQLTAGADLEDGQVYLQAWHAPGDLALAGGAPVPEVETSIPLVAATLVGRNPSTGALAEVAIDGTGRLVMSNPAVTSASSDAVPDTLALRNSVAGAAFSVVHAHDRSVSEADGVGAALTVRGGAAKGDHNGGDVDVAGGEGYAQGGTVRVVGGDCLDTNAEGYGGHVVVSGGEGGPPAHHGNIALHGEPDEGGFGGASKVVLIGDAAVAPTGSADQKGSILWSEADGCRVMTRSGLVTAVGFGELGSAYSANPKLHLRAMGRLTWSSGTQTILSVSLPTQTYVGIATFEIHGFNPNNDAAMNAVRRTRLRRIGSTMNVSTQTVGSDVVDSVAGAPGFGASLTITIDTSAPAVRVRVSATGAAGSHFTCWADIKLVAH